MAKNDEQKKTNPILMFLFAVVIPLLIVGAIILVVLNFAGINVFGWMKERANEVPIVSSFVTTEEEAAIEEYVEQIEEQTAQIEELEETTEAQQQLIDELEQELLYYENSFESLEELERNIDEREAERANESRAIASTFSNMDSEQAAAILEEMPTEDARTILQGVSSKVSGGILEAMNPEAAAELTQMLLEAEGP